MSNWFVYGLIQINAEEKGYSEIIVEGKTDPLLKIPPPNYTGAKIPYGWKRLTAVYNDDFKEIYFGSFRRTLVFFGAKVYINCPCVFYKPNTKKITLTAHLFANNRKVPGGYGRFYIGEVLVSKNPVQVKDGVAKDTVEIPNDIVLESGLQFTFKYTYNERYLLAPDEGHGKLYPAPTTKIPLTVEVQTIITNIGESWNTTKLIARVYHTNHGTVINYPDDIPSGGYVTFYVDGKKIGSANLISSGFATHSFNPTSDRADGIGVGTHNITATYTPDTPELKAKYEQTSGCGTLFIGDATGKPVHTKDESFRLCGSIGNDGVTLNFKFASNLNGKIQAYMDYDLLTLKDNGRDVTEITVSGKSFSIVFSTVGGITQSLRHWNYSGKHNFYLKYSVYDGTYATETEPEGVPLEYYYYFDYFYMQIPVYIELVGELDTNSQTKPNGSREFVGNNIYYINSSNNYQWKKTPVSARPKSTTVGNKIQVRVVNTENNAKIVEGGTVILRFKTRNEVDNMGERF